MSDDLYHEGFAQVYTKEDKTLEPTTRLMYTDEDGNDYDVLDMRDALIAIRANTKPTAVSLSPKNRIRAIYEICCRALPDETESP
jgi:hypothetical protein